MYYICTQKVHLNRTIMNTNNNQELIDHTECVCQALSEVKMIKDGKIKEPSMDDFLCELDKAIIEVNDGNVKTFDSLDEMMAYLND